MRHRKAGKQLGRPGDQRKALLRGVVDALLRHNRIKTTIAKAKQAAPIAEKIITKAKRGDLAARRQVLRQINDPDLVDYLFTQIAPRYTDRPGGYTRVLKAGYRHGDSAPGAVIELVDRDESVKGSADRARHAAMAERSPA